MSRRFLLGCLAVALSGLGCSADEPAPTGAPTASAPESEPVAASDAEVAAASEEAAAPAPAGDKGAAGGAPEEGREEEGDEHRGHDVPGVGSRLQRRGEGHPIECAVDQGAVVASLHGRMTARVRSSGIRTGG